MSLSAERLTALDNLRADHVCRVSGLVGRSTRSHSDLMFVEGPQAVREPVVYRPDTMCDVYVREDAWEMYADAVDVARRVMCWVYPVIAEASAALSGDSQGIRAVTFLDALPRELPGPNVGGTIAVLVQGCDPGNVDTIARTAGAFGAIGVVTVTGTVDAASPKVVRSSAGFVFHIPVCMVLSFADARALIHGRSAALLGTSGGAASINLFDFLVQGASARSRLSQSHTWVFDNEVHGLSDDKTRLCDGLASTPTAGDAKSLNVASAVATYLLASQTVRGVEN